MLTELVKEELMALGIRYRADYLVEQSGYTAGVAALDGQALKETLPKGYLDELVAETAKLNTLRQDKALTDAESKETTRAQGNAIRDGKVCRRKMSKRGLMAKRMGKPIPDGLIKLTQASSPQALSAELTEKAKLFEANMSSIPGVGNDKILKEAKDLAQSLLTLDAKQEVKRLKELPDAVARFYEQKGRVYTGIKVVHDAGHALHAGDAQAAAKYNFSILYRKTGAKAAKEAPKGDGK